jgi:DNA-binding LytR/AlgR family response regulator
MGKIIVKNRFCAARLDEDSVLYVRKALRKVVVYTESGSYWEYGPMEKILKQASDRMFRCHRSLAVNMDNIREFTTGGLVLADGRKLSMCHAALRGVKKACGAHLTHF